MQISGRSIRFVHAVFRPRALFVKRALLIFFFISESALAQIPRFKNGDRVAFMGNSITHAGYYESYVWLYYMTHFPAERITVLNAGIGGDVVGQMNDRFDQDLLPLKPNKLFLTFGMNDSGYFEFLKSDARETAAQRLEKCRAGFAAIQDKMLAHPEIEKYLMASSPYDETMQNKDNLFPGKSRTMEAIVAMQKQTAASRKWGFVDLYHPMQAINLSGQKNDPKFTLTGPDRIHPGKAGHLVMAALILEAQGLKDQPVSDVAIDAAGKKIVGAVNAKISGLKTAAGGLSFDYLAQALPFPIDTASTAWGNPQKQSDALAVYPFIRNFNREMLIISALPKGRYLLQIDGDTLGRIDADSLAKGLNLAAFPNSPQYRQALSVMHLNDQRAEIEGKLREYYWLQFNYFKGINRLFDDSDSSLVLVRKKARSDGFVNSKIGIYETARFREVRDLWQHDMQVLTDKIYTINKPVPHHIQLTRM